MKIKAALLLFFLSIVIYSNSLGGAFIYDDEYFVVKNINIRNLENIPSFFTSSTAVAFSELSQDVYRPITAASYALDFSLWKLNTFGYHLVNVIFHSMNAVLVFLIFLVIFGDVFTAFCAGALFAVHPVGTAAVSWISGRSSVLFLFFYLTALLYYILSRKKEKGRHSFYLPASLILYTFSLFSKEMAVTLPFILIAYDIHFGTPEPFRKKVYRYLPYFILTALFIAIRALVLQRVSQCGWWGGNPYYTFLTMLQVLVEYIKLLLAPVNLCAFYVTNIYTSIADTKVIFSLFILGAIFLSLPFVFRRQRGISFGIWWFFITLLPVSNIVPLRALMAERFLYLPAIGFCLIAAICIQKASVFFARKKEALTRFIAVVLAALLFVAYSARTMARNEDWKDSLTITNSILKITPLNPWALASLGAAYSGQEQYEKAIKPLLKAITLSDSYFSPRSILGFCYLELGRYNDAITVLNDALKMKPDNLEALNSLGVAYANVKQYDEAIKQFERSIQIDKTFASAYINLGTAYDQMGAYDKALEAYGRVEANTNSRQDIAVAYIRMGDTCIKMKRIDKAKECYAKAISLCGRGMDQLKQVASDRLNAKWDVR